MSRLIESECSEVGMAGGGGATCEAAAAKRGGDSPKERGWPVGREVRARRESVGFGSAWGNWRASVR